MTSRLVYIFRILAAVALAAPASGQGLTQLACRVVIEHSGDTVSAFAIVQADQPTKVDYTLKAIKISPSGSGTTEQSGTQDVEVGRTAVLSQTSFKVEPDGWIEFELDITERLTGATCAASEVISKI